MVARTFAQLSPQARTNVQRISRGRPPEDFGGESQRFLNEAIDFINQDPALRRRIGGGFPIGFDPEKSVVTERQKELFRESQLPKEIRGLSRISPIAPVVLRREQAALTAAKRRKEFGITPKPKITTKTTISKIDLKDLKTKISIDPKTLKELRPLDGKVDQGTIQIRTEAERIKFETAQITAAPFGEFVEKIEVAIFPALVGPKFLSSQLGAKLTSGKLQEEDRETADKVNELLGKTKGIGIDARKAAIELTRLIRETDRQIKRDVKKSESIGKTFKSTNEKFNTINSELASGNISEETAIRRQNELLNKLKNQGFIIEQTNGSVNISHPIYDRLGGFTGSAWSNILKAARKGDSPIKDQALIASLDFLNKAYQAEKIILSFQLAGVGAKGIGIKAPTITGSARTKRVLNTVSALSSAGIIGSIGAFKGIEALIETGEPLLAITSAAGTIAGFISPAALRKTNQLLRKIDERIKTQKPISQSKRARAAIKTKQVQVQKQKAKAKKKLQITNKQAVDAFKKLSRSEQINLWDKSLRGDKLTPENLQKVKKFMEAAGLKDFQVQDRLAELSRRIQLRAVRDANKFGILSDSETKIQVQRLRQGKQQLVKLLKERTIASQKEVITKPILSQGQLNRQLSIQRQIAQTKSKLAKGFLTPLQENILRNQILALERQIKVISLKPSEGFQIKIETVSPQILSIQRQVQASKELQLQIKQRINQAQTQTMKASLQRQLTLQKQRQDQLQRSLQVSKQRQNQLTNQRSLTLTVQRSNQVSRQLQQTKQRQRQLTRQLSLTKNTQTQKSLQDQFTIQKQKQRTLTRELEKLKITKKIIRRRIIRGGGEIIKPTIIKPIFFKPGKKKKKKKPFGIDKKSQGYNAFAKQRGLFRKLNKVPLTKRQARDLSAFVVDNSTSATGRIIKTLTQKPKKPKTRIPSNYFSKTRKKYRTNKIVRGKKVPLKNIFIERRRHRIDSLGEKLGLSAARAVAKLRKKVVRKKPFKPDNSKLSKKLRRKKK